LQKEGVMRGGLARDEVDALLGDGVGLLGIGAFDLIRTAVAVGSVVFIEAMLPGIGSA